MSESTGNKGSVVTGKQTGVRKERKRGKGVPSNEALSTISNITAVSVNKPITPEMKKSSITVKGSTRIMLNALVMLDKAETIDDMVMDIVSDYVDTELTDDEKKEYTVIVDRLLAKLNK